MISLLCFSAFLGFFLLYNTSKKAVLNRSIWLEKITQDNPKYSTVIGCLLNLAVLIGCIVYWGVGSGIFAFFVILMTAGSTVVLIAPLRYVNYKHVTGLCMFFLVIELLVN